MDFFSRALLFTVFMLSSTDFCAKFLVALFFFKYVLMKNKKRTTFRRSITKLGFDQEDRLIEWRT